MAARALAIALVGALLVAGCFGGGGKGGGGGGDPSSSTSGSASTGPAGPIKARFSWTPDYPRAGANVTFTGAVDGLGNGKVSSYAWDWGDGKTGSGAVAKHAFDASGEWKVTFKATLGDGRTLSQVRPVLVLAPGQAEPIPPGGNGTAGPPPPPPGKFTCPGPGGAVAVEEPFDTFGVDESLPNLAWAALKTGFRFAVAWSSESPTTGSLTYTVANGTPQTVSETLPTRAHLLVLDGLPVGKALCFTVTEGGTTTALHAVRLANAMTSFQEGSPHGAYTMNSLVLVNELGDLAEVQEGVDDYADRLWDATDGWVRAGATLIIVNDPAHHNAGWVTCYVITLGPPLCTQVYDVLFTNDAAPQGAASTYRRGVHEPRAAIWMNQYHQAMPGPVSMDDTGSVLTHEMGHYIFDMDDLYGDPVVPDSQDCDVPGLSISIMGGPREATEFDDEVNRCPTQPSGYVPSWTLMRAEFPRIPDRTTEPLDGPDGNGGLHLQRTYRGA